MNVFPTFAFLLGFIASPQILSAKVISDEAAYFLHSKEIPNPGIEVENDEILRFEEDITNDGKPEVFFSKASFRDGKQGNIWSIYSKVDDDSLRLLGEVTFNRLAFSPMAWSNDEKQAGFYTYGPGGAAQGLLMFYAIVADRIERLEQRQIAPTTTDKAEYDRLFTAKRDGEASLIDVKRTLVADVMKNIKNTEATQKSHENQPKAAPPINSEKKQSSLPDEIKGDGGNDGQKIKLWSWFFGLAALLFIAWKMFKLRSGRPT